MIYTITLNPSIDYVIQMDHLELGTVNRMDTDFKFPGGKGINVSRILQRLEIPNTALGYVGGFTGAFITNELAKENITTDFISIAEDTRINVKIKAQQETEINGAGPMISEAEQQQLFDQLSQVTKEDIVVFAGSTPKNLKDGFYQKLIQFVTERGAQFVIDTTGKDLEAALSFHPLVVKPNKDELAELYQTTFETQEDIYPYAQKLMAEGAQQVLISMAGDGALLFEGENIYFAAPLKKPLKNSVGAGDSMIAGFTGTYAQTKNPLEAFKMGVACGSATAFSDDLATADFIQECYNEVVIEKIK